MVDPRWSVEALLDQANAVKSAYGYLAYGEANPAVSKSAAGFDAASNPYRYTGKRFDPAARAYDMGARHYFPQRARWFQRDLYPDALANLGLSLDPLNANRYRFTAANPINLIELDGHAAVDLGELLTRSQAILNWQQESAKPCNGKHCKSGARAALDAADLLSTVIPTPAAAAKLLAAGVRIGKNAIRAKKANKAAKGGAAPVRVGQAGEDAVRGAYNIGDKTAITVNGRGRIPDGLTATTLSEVKNVASLSYTRQLQDFVDYARANGLRVDLYVRGGASPTRFSGPLQDAIRDPANRIRLRRIP